MKNRRLPYSIRFCLGLASFLFCASSGIGQQNETRIQREILIKAEKQLALCKAVADSTIDRLISISNDSSTIDSVKVEIVYLFGDCLVINVQNILSSILRIPISYGIGASGIDQFNT